MRYFCNTEAKILSCSQKLPLVEISWLTTDILLSSQNFTFLTAVLQHPLQKGLMTQCVRISYQSKMSSCSSDGHIATSDLLQKTTLPYGNKITSSEVAILKTLKCCLDSKMQQAFLCTSMIKCINKIVNQGYETGCSRACHWVMDSPKFYWHISKSAKSIVSKSSWFISHLEYWIL